MPVLDGIAATSRLIADPDCLSRVLILTTFDDDEHVFDALAAGASGFLLKDAPADELLNAIRVVAGGDAMLAPAVTRRLMTTSPASGRARGGREREHAHRSRTGGPALMADGLNNAEIARTLVIGEATVKTHVARIVLKLGARDRVQAVITAYRSGLAYEDRPGPD